MMTEELDFEAEIPVSLSTNDKIVNEVECSTPNVIKEEFVTEVINCDAGEISCDAGVMSDTGELRSDKGNVKSVTRKVEPDTEGVKCDTLGVESLSDTEVKSDTGEIHSDTGEILNDDLEEGELEDIPTQTKTSEVVCRYYQRGICLYGSHCRNYHPIVYNMFDPVLSNKSNFKPFELQTIHKPPVFQPYPIAMVPDIESSWERGIKMAKIVMQNNSNKQSQYSDIENDWEKCLAEAKANIQKASFKRKTNYIEKPYFDSKYSKQETFRERSPMKREHDLKDFKQKYSKNYSSKFEKESNYEMKAKPFDAKQTPDHLQYVDPWRRSKSPRKRTRSMSFSISPSPRRSRERSASSSSSSSSYFKQIYDHSPKGKPSRKKSRSHSASPHSKKGKTSKAHTYNKKRSYSKSFSKSPRKRPYSSSSSSESSGKDYDRKKPYNKERKLDTKQARVGEIKNGKRYTPSERSKKTSLQSTTKSSYKKTCRRASSPSNSDSSSAGSYLTYTSVSSLTDLDDLQTTYSEEQEGKNFSKRDQVPQEKKKEDNFKPNKKDLGNNQSMSRIFRKLSEDFDVCVKQKKTLSDVSKLQIPSEASTKSKSYSDKICGSQSTTSHQSSKPTTNKKLTNQKPSAAAMELLMYHTKHTGDKANSSSLVNKSSQAKSIPLPAEAAKSKNNTYSKVPITKEVASKNTPAVPIKLNLCAANVKKEAVSKRNMLLQQLQAIEDAIARKKQPA